MRIVVQRCTRAEVTVAGEVVGAIGQGLVLLVGISLEDTEADVDYTADKIVNLRIFEDGEGKMNHSLLEVHGSLLSISQFTLYGDVRKGRRPNFVKAARPAEAQRLYEAFNDRLRSYGVRVETGIFGAMMDVSLTNDGPVTLLLDSRREF